MSRIYLRIHDVPEIEKIGIRKMAKVIEKAILMNMNLDLLDVLETPKTHEEKSPKIKITINNPEAQKRLNLFSLKYRNIYIKIVLEKYFKKQSMDSKPVKNNIQNINEQLIKELEGDF